MSLAYVGAMAILLSAAGCLSNLERPEPPDTITAWPVAEADLDGLWETTLDVLRKHSFEPTRQDRAMGIIETRPTTSRQLAEFWRQDVDLYDHYGILQASLHTIRRKATVRFVNTPEGWQIEVRVDIERLSMQESQVTTASAAIHGFSGVLPTTEGEIFENKADRMTWISEGRDALMEERLLQSILRSYDPDAWYAADA